MKRTDLYHELLGLADSLDHCVSTYQAGVAIHRLSLRVLDLDEFEEES